MNNLGRTTAYVALATALLATAFTLNDRRYPAVDASGRSAASSAHDAELARCKTIGLEAAEDNGCKAVWEANRKRFFQFGRQDQDSFTDDIPVAPDVKTRRAPAGEDLPGGHAR